MTAAEAKKKKAADKAAKELHNEVLTEVGKALPETVPETLPETVPETVPEAVPEATGIQQSFFCDELENGDITDIINEVNKNTKQRKTPDLDKAPKETPQTQEVKRGRGRPPKEDTPADESAEQPKSYITGAMLNIFTFSILPEIFEKLSKGRFAFNKIDKKSFESLTEISDTVAQQIPFFKNPIVGYFTCAGLLLWANRKTD